MVHWSCCRIAHSRPFPACFSVGPTEHTHTDMDGWQHRKRFSPHPTLLIPLAPVVYRMQRIVCMNVRRSIRPSILPFCQASRHSTPYPQSGCPSIHPSIQLSIRMCIGVVLAAEEGRQGEGGRQGFGRIVVWVEVEVGVGER